MKALYIQAQVRYLKYLTIMSLCFSFIILAGCKTNFLRSPLSSQTTAQTAAQHLQLAATASLPASALEHRLLAANLFIQAQKIEDAQRVLRETKNAEAIDANVHKSILSARLALLQKDTTKAQADLNTALTILNQYTRSNLTGASPSTQHIALLLPTKGPHAQAAKIVKDGFLAAFYQAKQNQSTLPSVKVYDTSSQSIPEAYQKALSEQATIIVGPLTKPEVQTIATLRLDIPVLALNTIAENSAFPRKLYQFGLMPEDEVFAVAEHALRQGHRKALILAPQNEWGKRLVDTFKATWTARGAEIVDTRFFKSPQELESKIRTLLQIKGTIRRSDADMIFIAANHDLARQIKPLLNFYYAETLPVYATASVYTGIPMPNKDQDLNSVHFCDMPWVLQQSAHIQEAYNTLQKLWPNSISQSPRFFALGMDAYLLATQLENAQSISVRNNVGFTGELQLNNYQRIQRGLVCARFEQGVPVPD